MACGRTCGGPYLAAQEVIQGVRAKLEETHFGKANDEGVPQVGAASLRRGGRRCREKHGVLGAHTPPWHGAHGAPIGRPVRALGRVTVGRGSAG